MNTTNTQTSSEADMTNPTEDNHPNNTEPVQPDTSSSEVDIVALWREQMAEAALYNEAEEEPAPAMTEFEREQVLEVIRRSPVLRSYLD